MVEESAIERETSVAVVGQEAIVVLDKIFEGHGFHVGFQDRQTWAIGGALIGSKGSSLGLERSVQKNDEDRI